jgi:hypothetical protein
MMEAVTSYETQVSMYLTILLYITADIYVHPRAVRSSNLNKMAVFNI